MAGRSRRRMVLVMVGGLLAVGVLGSAGVAGAAVKDSNGLYVPKPDQGARIQIGALRDAGDTTDAALLQSMIETPQAVWFTTGTPKQVEQSVRTTLKQAKGSTAVLVAYDIPGRDCANLSAGGAANLQDYELWIDGFASGIGDSNTIVILEPDGLGLLPEGCVPAVPFTNFDRYAELNYAVSQFAALPNTKVYLDGTHSAWLSARDNATRLLAAGVQNADGFFLNVSNYQFAPNLVQYGTWVSKCITMLTVGPAGDCPDQYYNGGPLPSLIAQTLGEWVGSSLSPYGVWSDTDPTVVNGQMPFNTSGENMRLANVVGTTHFVIDTSRNGVGPWHFPANTYLDPQDWCNPPDRGLGILPTLDTGNPLLDAYLWIKTPGQSDGTCTRGGAPGSVDPVRGVVDPAAGQWFPQQALELAQLANPVLVP